MPPTYTPPECDVVVLAGDISPGLPGVVWAKETFSVPVVYVLGNHEYYVGRTMAEQVEKMKELAEGSNVHILDNEVAEIEGVRFIGSTLWTDFNLFGQHIMAKVIAQRGLGDYIDITTAPGVPLTADDTERFHQIARQFITDELSKPFDGKTVVVTHHAPSYMSIAPKWQNHALTPAFASRLEHIITDFQPDLWLHGHVHDSFDYLMGKTRVRVNPRGYVRFEHNRLYTDQLVLEI